jgi:hypothetical protein
MLVANMELNVDDTYYAISGVIESYCTRSATWLVDSGNNTVTIAIKRKLGVNDES